MPNMTLSIPNDLKKEMDAHPEFNWSEVARQAFRRSISEIDTLRHLLRNSELTEEDALLLGRKVKAGIAKRYKQTDY